MGERPIDPEAPAVHEGVLDESALADLRRDVEAAAEVLSVSVRAGARGGGEPAGTSLGDSFEMLRSGEARAVQIRYRFEGAVWTDTLIRESGCFRVVRVRAGGDS